MYILFHMSPTPALGKWAEWVVTGHGLCRIEWTSGDVVNGSVLTHLLELLNVIHHVHVRSLPSRRPRVVVHVVRTTSRVSATLPSAHQQISKLVRKCIFKVHNVSQWPNPRNNKSVVTTSRWEPPPTFLAVNNCQEVLGEKFHPKMQIFGTKNLL